MLYPSPSSLLLCLLVATISPVLCQQNVCPGTPQALISGDVYRVEDDQLSASSILSDSNTPPEARVRVSGANSWCADESDTEPWFQVDFNRDVVIHTLEIGGAEGFDLSFITDFTIEHGPSSSQLSSILRPNSNQPMIFERDNSPDLRRSSLPTPLTTRVLRIVVVRHFPFTRAPCLFLEAFGCPLPTATTDAPVPTTMISTTAAPGQTTTMSTTSAPATDDIMSSGDNVRTSTGDVVGGAVAGVILIFLHLVLLMAILLGCLLAKQRSGKKRETPPPSQEPQHNQQTDNESFPTVTPRTTALHITNRIAVYETIDSPSPPPYIAYENVGTSLVCTHAIVGIPNSVALLGNSQAEGFSEDNQVLPITANTAYGSGLTDNVAYGSNGNLTDNVAYGSNGNLTDNVAYGRGLTDNIAYVPQ